jgi:hypothetical protein
MNKNSMFFVGLDLGDKFSYITFVDQDGEMIEESRLPTTKASFQRKFSTLQPCRIAMEVGAHSRWASHLLTELRHDVLVANARKLRLIYHNPRKGDRADAEILARLARLDPKLLSPIHHRSPQAQADLAVLRSRDAIVRCRTLLTNHARDIVKASGSRLPSCSADSFAQKAAPHIPEPLRPALAPILDTIASLTKQIRAYDQKVETLCFNATLRPGCSVLSAAWAHSQPWATSSPLRTPFASTGAGRWVQPWALSRGETNPAIKTLSCESPRPEIPTCDDCSLDLPNTSWDLSDRIAT